MRAASGIRPVSCHNTVPYFDDVWGAVYEQSVTSGRAPGYQGEVVDRLLPPDRRFRFEIGSDRALIDAVGAEVTALGGAPFGAGRSSTGPPAAEALKHGIHELRGRFAARHFVEVGIGCEACHGGSREHVDDPRVLPDFAPRSAFLAARPAVGRADGQAYARRADQPGCAPAVTRCSSLATRLPGKGGSGVVTARVSSITSGEGRDLLLGGCARQMSCVTCHDPHGEDRRAELERLATPAGNGVCVRCHAQYAGPAALARHAHHDPNGAGASCVGCHMPRKNMGLGYGLTRYHRIGLPDDPVGPSATVRSSARSATPTRPWPELWSPPWNAGGGESTIALRWPFSTAASTRCRCRPRLERGRAHEQAAALATLGTAGVKAAAPAIARQLVNPFPLVRYYARRALEALGAPACAVDSERPTAEIQVAVRACVPEAFAAGSASPDLPAAAAPTRGGNDVDED